ncbi:unnamed protein product [Durusdinium trenchii]
MHLTRWASLVFVVCTAWGESCDFEEGSLIQRQPRNESEIQEVEEHFKQLQRGLHKHLLGTTVIGATAAPKGGTCALSGQQRCAVSAMKGTTIIQPGGRTSCLQQDGGPYQFVVRPGDAQKLLISFQGGGACWESTSFKHACVADIQEALSGSGLLSNSGPLSDAQRNPLRDYTVVEVLYCSGDIFLGDVTQSWASGRGPAQQLRQAGAVNLRAVLQWVQKNFKSVTSLVMMGSSAGALAAQVYSPTILELIPHQNAAVISDSYAGVFPSNTEGAVLQRWKACSLNIFSPEQQRACQESRIGLPDVVAKIIQEHPTVAYGFIQSKADSFQRLFYELVAFTIQRSFSKLSGPLFYKLSNRIFKEYNKHKNFLLFLVDGDNHEFNSQRIWNKAGIKGAVDGSPRGVLSLQGWVRKVLARSCTRSLGRGRLTKRLDSTKLNYRYNRVFPKELCWA